jgi:CRP/FNR family cyclic AMP-dependent transcriptional regulator
MSGHLSLITTAQPNPRLEELIRRNAAPMTVPAKEIFLTEERTGKGVYYIVSGRTRHYLIGADGLEKIFYVLTPGWFFGENTRIISAQPRFYVMAEEKTELLFIPDGTFQTLLRQSPVFNEAIMRCLASKIQMLSHEIENQAFLSGRNRLLELLYHLADPSFAFDGKWYSLKRNYPQQELGAILGVSRVTVSKFVNELCNEGVIRIVNRRMQINIEHYRRLEDMIAEQ